MPLSANDAWSLVEDASKSLESCQLLSVSRQRRLSYALETLKASPAEVVDPHQICSLSMQKRRKFYHFLSAVLYTCGPDAVLITAAGLTQTIVSGMTNDQRNGLCEKLASKVNWQLPPNPNLQYFVTQLRALAPKAGTLPWQQLAAHADYRMLETQEMSISERPVLQTQHIVWVGIPAGSETILHNPYLHVPICFKDLDIFQDVDSPFRAVSKHLVEDLQSKLGPSFIEFENKTSKNVAFVHQSVLMMLFVACVSGATVDFYNWESDKEDFIHKVLALTHDRLSLFISDTSCNEAVEDVYKVTDYIEAVRANFNVYPKRSEWSWSQQKVGDIRILDDIALKSHAWRPKTCPGMGNCLITRPQGGQMVLKRSHSCAGREVKVVAMTKREKLLCKTSVPDQASKRVRHRRNQVTAVQNQRFTYFHQEYVPTFRRTGEFRVWICDGQIICAFRTKDDETLPGKPMALRQLDTNEYSDFHWYSPDRKTRKQKHDELLQFVLDTDSRIRQLRSDRFDTLRVGARYDCGISPDHGFYVNELTRFTNADTFSGLLAPPHDQIIGPLSKIIAQKLVA